MTFIPTIGIMTLPHRKGDYKNDEEKELYKKLTNSTNGIGILAEKLHRLFEITTEKRLFGDTPKTEAESKLEMLQIKYVAKDLEEIKELFEQKTEWLANLPETKELKRVYAFCAGSFYKQTPHEVAYTRAYQFCLYNLAEIYYYLGRSSASVQIVLQKHELKQEVEVMTNIIDLVNYVLGGDCSIGNYINNYKYLGILDRWEEYKLAHTQLAALPTESPTSTIESKSEPVKAVTQPSGAVKPKKKNTITIETWLAAKYLTSVRKCGSNDEVTNWTAKHLKNLFKDEVGRDVTETAIRRTETWKSIKSAGNN